MTLCVCGGGGGGDKLLQPYCLLHNGMDTGWKMVTLWICAMCISAITINFVHVSLLFCV